MNLLEEGVNACRSLSDGIQLEPLREYFLSSLFLRMTGAQEQKLKCLCWELATHDMTMNFDTIGFKVISITLGKCRAKKINRDCIA